MARPGVLPAQAGGPPSAASGGDHSPNASESSPPATLRQAHSAQSGRQLMFLARNRPEDFTPSFRPRIFIKQLFYHLFFPYSLAFVVWLDGLTMARNLGFLECNVAMVFSNWFLTLQAQAVAALFLYSWARPDLESGIAGAEILIMLAMLSTQKLLIAFKYSLMLPRDYARMSTSRVDQARRLSEQLISGWATVPMTSALLLLETALLRMRGGYAFTLGLEFQIKDMPMIRAVLKPTIARAARALDGLMDAHEVGRSVSDGFNKGPEILGALCRERARVREARRRARDRSASAQSDPPSADPASVSSTSAGGAPPFGERTSAGAGVGAGAGAGAAGTDASIVDGAESTHSGLPSSGGTGSLSAGAAQLQAGRHATEGTGTASSDSSGVIPLPLHLLEPDATRVSLLEEVYRWAAHGHISGSSKGDTTVTLSLLALHVLTTRDRAGERMLRTLRTLSLTVLPFTQCALPFILRYFNGDPVLGRGPLGPLIAVGNAFGLAVWTMLLLAFMFVSALDYRRRMTNMHRIGQLLEVSRGAEAVRLKLQQDQLEARERRDEEAQRRQDEALSGTNATGFLALPPVAQAGSAPAPQPASGAGSEGSAAPAGQARGAGSESGVPSAAAGAPGRRPRGSFRLLLRQGSQLMSTLGVGLQADVEQQQQAAARALRVRVRMGCEHDVCDLVTWGGGYEDGPESDSSGPLRRSEHPSPAAASTDSPAPTPAPATGGIAGQQHAILSASASQGRVPTASMSSTPSTGTGRSLVPSFFRNGSGWFASSTSPSASGSVAQTASASIPASGGRFNGDGAASSGRNGEGGQSDQERKARAARGAGQSSKQGQRRGHGRRGRHRRGKRPAIDSALDRMLRAEQHHGDEFLMPHMKLDVAHNYRAWFALRRLVLAFGLRFWKRVQLYTSIVALLIAALVAWMVYARFLSVGDDDESRRNSLVVEVFSLFDTAVLWLVWLVMVYYGHLANAQAAVHASHVLEVQLGLRDTLAGACGLRDNQYVMPEEVIEVVSRGSCYAEMMRPRGDTDAAGLALRVPLHVHVGGRGASKLGGDRGAEGALEGALLVQDQVADASSDEEKGRGREPGRRASIGPARPRAAPTVHAELPAQTAPATPSSAAAFAFGIALPPPSVESSPVVSDGAAPSPRYRARVWRSTAPSYAARRPDAAGTVATATVPVAMEQAGAQPRVFASGGLSTIEEEHPSASVRLSADGGSSSPGPATGTAPKRRALSASGTAPPPPSLQQDLVLAACDAGTPMASPNVARLSRGTPSLREPGVEGRVASQHSAPGDAATEDLALAVSHFVRHDMEHADPAARQSMARSKARTVSVGGKRRRTRARAFATVKRVFLTLFSDLDIGDSWRHTVNVVAQSRLVECDTVCSSVVRAVRADDELNPIRVMGMRASGTVVRTAVLLLLSGTSVVLRIAAGDA